MKKMFLIILLSMLVFSCGEDTVAPPKEKRMTVQEIREVMDLFLYNNYHNSTSYYLPFTFYEIENGKFFIDTVNSYYSMNILEVDNNKTVRWIEQLRGNYDGDLREHEGHKKFSYYVDSLPSIYKINLLLTVSK